MLKMRLTRLGSKDRAHYRVVVQEARSKRDGRYVENLGYYNPRTEPSTIVLKMDRVDYWIGVGAQPSDSVASLLRRARATGGEGEAAVASAPAAVAAAVAPAAPPALAVTPVSVPPLVADVTAPVVETPASAPALVSDITMSAEETPVSAPPLDPDAPTPATEVGETTVAPTA